MTRLLTLDDIIDTYSKLRSRGSSFNLSKFSFNSTERTKSAFNEIEINSANWWVIPKMYDRWNHMMTGNSETEFVEFLMNKHLGSWHNLKMLSLGSGKCPHELKLASYPNFDNILCIDVSDSLIRHAEDIATSRKLKNIDFRAQDVYDYDFPKNQFDIVFFHASLHHFKNVDAFLKERVRKTLKDNGILILIEYVGPNRMQYPKHQIQAINQALKIIPEQYRSRYGLKAVKNRFHGFGLLRMIIADPSECVDSESILPAVYRYFDTIHEAPFGGNILMVALKDLGHHFIELNAEKEAVLQQLFDFEDHYLKQYQSDFVFGIYKNKPVTHR